MRKRRKQNFNVTLFEEVADRYRQLGGTLSGGIARAQELLDASGAMQREIDKRYAHEMRVATAATPLQDPAISGAESTRLLQERLDAKSVAHWCAQNAINFSNGHDLLNMERAPPALRDAVYTDAVEKYGWQRGPRPAGMGASPAAAASPATHVEPDYDSVFGDTVSRPPATTAERMLAGTQDCWRCAAPVPVTHVGACPVCDALSPHGIRQPGEASADEMRAAALAEDDAKEFERHAIRDCWNCHIGLPVVPALARCPECGALDPCGETPLEAPAFRGMAAANPDAALQESNTVVLAGEGNGLAPADVEPPCNSVGSRYGLYCVRGTEGCDAHAEDVTRNQTEKTPEPDMTKPPHAAPESDISEPSF